MNCLFETDNATWGPTPQDIKTNSTDEVCVQGHRFVTEEEETVDEITNIFIKIMKINQSHA